MHRDRLRLALDAGGTGIWNWLDATQDFVGDRGLSVLWGLAEGQQISTALLRDTIVSDDVARVWEELRRGSAPDGPERVEFEFRVHRPGDAGGERWISLQGRRYPSGAADGGPVELIGMARDVTHLKQRDRHVHMLMREVTHRSKNLLAIIQAMARQTVKDSITAIEFEARFSTRLRGLAASHELLAARDWHGAPVEDLVRWQMGPALEAASDRIAISGPKIHLNPEAAQNVGLAINELASNATRFGALSGRDGRVSVLWSLDPAGMEPRRFHIAWQESGGPAVSQPSRIGFGHKVVERLAARALDGNVSLTFASTGLQWSMHIPASFVVDERDLPSLN